MRNTFKLLALSAGAIFIYALCMGCPAPSHEDEHGGNGPVGDDDDAVGDDDDAVGDDDDTMGDDDDAVGDDDDAVGDDDDTTGDDDDAAGMTGAQFAAGAASAACGNAIANECLNENVLILLGWADDSECSASLEAALMVMVNGGACTYDDTYAQDCIDELDAANCNQLRAMIQGIAIDGTMTGTCGMALSCN